MKIFLTYNHETIGKIYPQIASNVTGEISGLLIPNSNFFNIRRYLVKYNEIFQGKPAENIIEKTLDNLLRRKYRKLENLYQDIGIIANGIKISGPNSKILIIDNFITTGNGNPIINVEAWNLITINTEVAIPTYKAEYKYPSSPNMVITIEKEGERIFDY